jgi:hypothetical protein
MNTFRSFPFRPSISSWVADPMASKVKLVTIPLMVKGIVTNLSFEAIRSASQLETDGLKLHGIQPTRMLNCE